MTNAKGTIVAEPEPIDLDWAATALVIIDMQRDFMEPGGFGETLGNDVSQLARAVKPIGAVLAAARDTGMLVVHTREGHLPDLSDAPPAKVERGAPSKRIGDPGPMGRILIRGEAGHDIIPELYPLDGEIVIDKPGKGAFYATELGDVLQEYGIENLLVCGVTTEVCVNTTVREANDRGYRCVVIVGRLRFLLSRIPRDGPEDDQGPGRHLRLGREFGGSSQGDDGGDSRQTGSGGITMSTATTAGKGDFKPALWTPGDWNAFFGFGTNILVNMLVLTGLLRFVLKMPDSLVFGRILPALGLMMCLSTMYYAWLAYRLAQKTGRTDVCALPSGVSVPHMFIVTFVIMLPITLKTGDPVKGWSAGLVWVFFQSFILMIGGFIAPYIRKITPRAALLGTLAGVSVTFISMRPALEMYMTPQIGLVCFAIILASWFGGVRYPKGIPAGLVAIAAGMLIAWGSNLFGLGLGGLSLKGLGDAFAISASPCPFRRSATYSRGSPRLVAGLRVSLVLAATSALLAAIIGTLFGLIAGYFGGIADEVIGRVSDILFAFPIILLGLLVAVVMEPGISGVVITIVIATVPVFARVARGPTLSVRATEYTIAARVTGASPARILFRYVLPNISTPLLVQLAFTLSGALIAEGALSFLGSACSHPIPPSAHFSATAKRTWRSPPG